MVESLFWVEDEPESLDGDEMRLPVHPDDPVLQLVALEFRRPARFLHRL